MTRYECVPTTWDDVLDGQFFRIVCHLFDPHLVEAGSTLLGANDSELVSPR